GSLPVGLCWVLRRPHLLLGGPAAPSRPSVSRGPAHRLPARDPARARRAALLALLPEGGLALPLVHRPDPGRLPRASHHGLRPGRLRGADPRDPAPALGARPLGHYHRQLAADDGVP